MIAQGFGSTRDFLKERNNSAYCRLKKIPCGSKEQARARHPGEKCGLDQLTLVKMYHTPCVIKYQKKRVCLKPDNRWWSKAESQVAPTSVSFGENRRPNSIVQRQSPLRVDPRNPRFCWAIINCPVSYRKICNDFSTPKKQMLCSR
jgi:hypothetical protein